MIRTRKSTGELVMPYESFKRLGFQRVCKMLGIDIVEPA